MNAVGVDVSKGKSTIAVLRPFGEIVVSPFDVFHNPKELGELVTLLKSLDGETKVVMEYTGNYYLPIAQFLQNNGFFVSVINAILIHDYGNKSLRKAKTDKKDALKLASFALDRWLDLPSFSVSSDIRNLLKSYNRQYNQYGKLKVMLKNNLISLVDQSFPGANKLFNCPVKKENGHEKWIDFINRFPHAHCISKKSFASFSKAYETWCHKFSYRFTRRKMQEIYDLAHNCTPTLSFDESTTLLLESSITQLNCVIETQAKLAKEMHRLTFNLPEYQTVFSMYGVGPVLGSQLIAEIGDVARFKNKKSLVAFAGLDSPPFQSGTYNIKSRSISKRGSASLRKTLFQIMSIILQNAPKDNSVFLFMDKKRSEGKHFYVYMTAGANKFLRIYYARVTEQLNLL